MLRFLADDNFNYNLVKELQNRQPKLDILSLQKIGLSGINDDRLLELASQEGRVLLTNDVMTQLKQWVKNQPHVHVDETPWVVKGIKQWLWVVTNKLFCVFHAGDTRNAHPGFPPPTLIPPTPS